MATFNMDPIRGDMDYKALQAYIYKMNEQIQYSFANLESDNMSKKYVDRVDSKDGKSRTIKFDEKELEIMFEDFNTRSQAILTQTASSIDILVGIGDVVSELKVRIDQYGESITLNSNRIIIDASNFTLDDSGNATFSGSITGGSININNRFKVDSSGNATISGNISTPTLNPSQQLHAYNAYFTQGLPAYAGGDIRVGGDATSNGDFVTNTLAVRWLLGSSDARLKDIVRYGTGHSSALEHVMEQDTDTDVRYSTVKNGKRYISYHMIGVLIAERIQQNQKRIDELVRCLDG